jgi:hypothetical protein
VLKLPYLPLWNSVADMARKLRVEYPGAVYHVMKRGDRGTFGDGCAGLCESPALSSAKDEREMIFKNQDPFPFMVLATMPPTACVTW